MTDQPKSIGAAVHGWWKTSINAGSGAARKTRAQLRRASTPSEVLAIGATHDLHKRIATAEKGRIMRYGDDDPVRLALIAKTIASVDEHIPVLLPKLFGQTTGDNPPLSPLRFQRILRAEDDWALATRLRRALPLVGGKANAAALGDDLFHWGERVRNRWCFDYFGASAPSVLKSADADDSNENIPTTEDA